MYTQTHDDVELDGVVVTQSSRSIRGLIICSGYLRAGIAFDVIDQRNSSRAELQARQCKFVPKKCVVIPFGEAKYHKCQFRSNTKQHLHLLCIHDDTHMNIRQYHGNMAKKTQFSQPAFSPFTLSEPAEQEFSNGHNVQPTYITAIL